MKQKRCGPTINTVGYNAEAMLKESTNRVARVTWPCEGTESFINGWFRWNASSARLEFIDDKQRVVTSRCKKLPPGRYDVFRVEE